MSTTYRFLKAFLAAITLAQILPTTHCQNAQSGAINVEYFSDTRCTTPLIIPSGPDKGGKIAQETFDFVDGAVEGTIITASAGSFASCFVLSMSGIVSAELCEHGYTCFQPGCNTVPVVTQRCISVLNSTGSNGNPSFPGTQWDKFSATLEG